MGLRICAAVLTKKSPWRSWRRDLAASAKAQRRALGRTNGPRLAPNGFRADAIPQLVAAVLRKDRKATAEFISQYADAIYGYVRHRLSPRAHLVDDVVQDVFVAALAGLASFRGTSPLRSWLLGIARHKVEDVYRAQLREPESLDDSDGVEPAADGPAIEETIDRERVEARTQNVLRQLPEAYGIVLLWRYWESRSVQKIAEATGRTEKSVERLLARARARFKELWVRQ